MRPRIYQKATDHPSASLTLSYSIPDIISKEYKLFMIKIISPTTPDFVEVHFGRMVHPMIFRLM